MERMNDRMMRSVHPDGDGEGMTRRRLFELLGYGGLTLAAGTVAGAGRADAAAPPTLSTRLTREYGLAFPFVGAGMGFVALPELVAAVANAGGLGVLGLAPEPPPAVAVRIEQIRALTARPFGVDFFVATAAPPIGELTTDDHVAAVIAARAAGAPIELAVFHNAAPKPQWVAGLRDEGVRIWAQVASVDDALEAIDTGAEVLVVQGKEAGGHSKSVTPLKRLLRKVRRAVDDEVMLLAAGGIATGSDVVQALTHGAEGVWVGTRLVASTEAYAHPELKQRLVAAKHKDATVITRLFGPEVPCLPYRVLRTPLVDELLPIEDEICANPPDFDPPIGHTTLFPGTPFELPDVPMPRLSALVPTPDTVPTAGDLGAFGMPAGEGVRHIDDVRPVAEIIATMMAQARSEIAARL